MESFHSITFEILNFQHPQVLKFQISSNVAQLVFEFIAQWKSIYSNLWIVEQILVKYSTFYCFVWYQTSEREHYAVQKNSTHRLPFVVELNFLLFFSCALKKSNFIISSSAQLNFWNSIKNICAIQILFPLSDDSHWFRLWLQISIVWISKKYSFKYFMRTKMLFYDHTIWNPLNSHYHIRKASESCWNIFRLSLLTTWCWEELNVDS